MKTLNITLVLLFVSHLLMAQIPDYLMPTSQVKYPKIDNYNVAIFPINFTDIPAQYVDSMPTQQEWQEILFQGDIPQWFQDMSFNTTTFTGDVFDYTTSSAVFMDPSSHTPMAYQDILDNLDFIAPGFDIDSYDYIVFITCHDAAVQQSITTDKNFTINGESISRPVVCTSYQAGVWWRDSGNWLYNNQLTDSIAYIIPSGTGVAEEGPATYPMSRFEAVLLHEIGHSMWLDNHANSSTNGNQPAYATEIPNNSGFLNSEYGNKFDIMGSREYGITMNGSMRDICGLLDSSAIYSKNWWGKTTITVKPLSAGNGKRFIEVLLPDVSDNLGHKNHGFGLEIRPLDNYTTMMSNPLLSENTNGFFVIRTNGTENLLLDMSPSDNITFAGSNFADLRDVVLKQGMTYEDDDVKFENVVNNADGTWSIDITIKPLLIVTPEPLMTLATRAENGDITINWTNNCIDCQSDQLFTFEYRKIGDEFWSSFYDGVLTTETYTTSDFSTDTDVYEFRTAIGENTTHYPSLYSNSISTNSTAINNIQKTTFNIYPNPANSFVLISGHVIGNQVEIMDISGKVLKQFKIQNSEFKIQTADLQNGIYFVKVGTSVQKLIKR